MNTPVKIMLLTGVGGGGLGGSETFVIELIRHLDKKKFLPLLCCLDYGGDITDILHREMSATGCKFAATRYRTGMKIDLRAILWLRKIIREEKIDLVHANGGYSTIAGIFSVIGSAVPIIETQHRDIISFSNKTKFFLGLFTHRLSKRIAVSGVSAGRIRESDFLIPQKKADTVIHNGVDLHNFSPSMNNVLKKDEFGFSGPVIGCIAKLVQWKGHVYLLRAMAKVKEIFPAAALVLIGGGEEEAKLKLMSRELGLENNVRFLGYRSNIPEWLALFDFVVLPSLAESFSICILEAFAMGKAVIATEVGGTPEIVRDGENGFLVPPCDPARLAERMICLLSDPGLAKKMGLAGRALVESEFDIKRTVGRYEKVYLNVAGYAERSGDF